MKYVSCILFLLRLFFTEKLNINQRYIFFFIIKKQFNIFLIENHLLIICSDISCVSELLSACYHPSLTFGEQQKWHAGNKLRNTVIVSCIQVVYYEMVTNQFPVFPEIRNIKWFLLRINTASNIQCTKVLWLLIHSATAMFAERAFKKRHRKQKQL